MKLKIKQANNLDNEKDKKKVCCKSSRSYFYMQRKLNFPT